MKFNIFCLLIFAFSAQAQEENWTQIPNDTDGFTLSQIHREVMEQSYADCETIGIAGIRLYPIGHQSYVMPFVAIPRPIYTYPQHPKQDEYKSFRIDQSNKSNNTTVTRIFDETESYYVYITKKSGHISKVEAISCLNNKCKSELVCHTGRPVLISQSAPFTLLTARTL